jgi:HPt (histidine-containing phosphotransfer) domain-containing protein
MFHFLLFGHNKYENSCHLFIIRQTGDKSLLRPPAVVKFPKHGNGQSKIQSCTNLDFLAKRTKSNPELMQEMISIYLEQTPPLIDAMRQSLADKDWPSLHAAVHKIIPSFSIVGMHQDFEDLAKKIQEYAGSQRDTDKIPSLFLQIENICRQACTELEAALNKFKYDKA